MLSPIFLAVTVALVVSARSLPPNISNGFYHYDPNSIVQNEKILKLFLRLAANTASRLARLKAEAEEHYPLGIQEDYVDLTRPSSKVNVDGRLPNNDQLMFVPEELSNWRTDVYRGDLNSDDRNLRRYSYVPKMFEIKNGGFETRRSQEGIPENEVYRRNEGPSDLKEKPVLEEKITRISQGRKLEDEPDVQDKVKSERTLNHEDVLEERQEEDPSEVMGRAFTNDPNARSRLFLNIGNNHATNRSTMIKNINHDVPGGIQASGSIDLNVGLRTKDQSDMKDSSGHLKKAITDVSRLKNSAFINQDVGLKVNTFIPVLESVSNQENNNNIEGSVSGDSLLRDVLQGGSNQNTDSKKTSGSSTVKLSEGLWIGDSSSNRNDVDTVVSNIGLQDGSAVLTHQDSSSKVKVSLPGQGHLLNENKVTDWWSKEVNAEAKASNLDANSGGSAIVNQDTGFKTIVQKMDDTTNLKNNFTSLVNVDKITESEQKVMSGVQVPSSGYLNLSGWPGETVLVENAGEHSSGLPKSIRQPSSTQDQWEQSNVGNTNIHWTRPKYSELEDLDEKISKNKQHQMAVQVLDVLQPAEKVRNDHGLSGLNGNGDYAVSNIGNGRVTGIVLSGDSVLPSYVQQSKQKVSFIPGKSPLELTTKDTTLSIVPEDATKQQDWKEVDVQGAFEQIQGVLRPKKNLLLGVAEESKNNHVKIDPWILQGSTYNVETLKNPYISAAGHVQTQNQGTIYYPSGSGGTHSFTSQNNVGTTANNIAHRVNTPLIFVRNTGSGSLPVRTVQDVSWNTNDAAIGLGNAKYIAEDTAMEKQNSGSGFLTFDKLGANSAVGGQTHFGVEVTKTLGLTGKPREKDPWVLRGQIGIGHSKISHQRQQEDSS